MELSEDEWRSVAVESEGSGLKVVFRNTRTHHLVRKYYRLPPSALREAMKDGRYLGMRPGTFHTMESLHAGGDGQGRNGG
ncbi:hypothetical protein CR158_10780 [Halomonas heilongjiangensis]|uniref:Uncharacterized protein n=1 Tax=Halomonas heilongjiangensis TaxID=1387883 RepID=A0A2N7TU19_9GAMM|nr:hypothetical protein C1H66_01285 [Halomonas heilongjiangensis]PXX89427.1 hypothetical protein CR158_10780 [Halomonas heilongjiangensis]